MKGSEQEQGKVLRQRYGVNENEALWGLTKGEVFVDGTWREGTFVIFQSLVGFSEAGSLFDSDPLVVLPFAGMDKTKPPCVMKINDHPLHSNEIEPFRLWVLCDSSPPLPDSDSLTGYAFRSFPVDPINPKRIARLVTFLFDLSFDALPAHHQRLWDTIRKDAETTAVLHVSDLNALASSIMFPTTTALLTKRPDIVTLDNVAGMREEVEALEGELRGLGGPSNAASNADLRRKKRRECERLSSQIVHKRTLLDAALTAVDAVCGRFVGHLEHEIHGAFPKHDSTIPTFDDTIGTTHTEGQDADSSTLAEVIITNNRLYIGVIGSEGALSASVLPESPYRPTDVAFFFSGGTERTGSVASSPAASPREEAKEASTYRDTFSSLAFTSMKSVYRLQEIRLNPTGGPDRDPLSCTMIGSPPLSELFEEKRKGVRSSHLPLPSFFDPFVRPTEWAMSSGGHEETPLVSNAIKIVVAVDGSGRPCTPKVQAFVKTYVIRASEDVREYYHALVVSKWLRSCWKGVQTVKAGISRSLAETERKGYERRSASRQHARNLEPFHASQRSADPDVDINEVESESVESGGESDGEISQDTTVPKCSPMAAEEDLRRHSRSHSGGASGRRDFLYGSNSASSGNSNPISPPMFDLKMHPLPPWCTQRLLDHFQSVDESGDGDVLEADFCTALTPLFRSTVLPRAFYRIFDADGNGVLSFVEFLTGMALLLQGQADKLTFVFLLFDSDADGRISRAEFKEVVQLFLQLSGVQPRLIDYEAEDVTSLAHILFDSITHKKDPETLTLLEFKDALRTNRKIQIAFRRLKEEQPAEVVEHFEVGGDARGQSFLYEGSEVHTLGQVRPILGDVLGFVSESVESLCKYHLITFGHEDWFLLLDLLDGIKESTQSLPRHNSGPDSDGPIPCDANVFVKSGCAPGCFFFKKVSSGEYERDGERFRFINTDLPPVVYIDHAPLVFKKIRELSGISTNTFVDALGVGDMLENMLTGTTTALRHLIASGTSRGQFFFSSHDRQFIVKSISDAEKRIITRILPVYLTHLKTNPHTLLPKYYSMGTLMRNKVKINFLIMGRVLRPEEEVRQLYSLRASFSDALPSRLPEGNRKGVILTDIDLKRSIALDYEWYEQLLAQAAHDITFMKENALVGYSILAGFDSDKRTADGAMPVDPIARMDSIKSHLQRQQQPNGSWSLLRHFTHKRQRFFSCCGTQTKTTTQSPPPPPPTPPHRSHEPDYNRSHEPDYATPREEVTSPPVELRETSTGLSLRRRSVLASANQKGKETPRRPPSLSVGSDRGLGKELYLSHRGLGVPQTPSAPLMKTSGEVPSLFARCESELVVSPPDRDLRRPLPTASLPELLLTANECSTKIRPNPALPPPLEATTTRAKMTKQLILSIVASTYAKKPPEPELPEVIQRDVEAETYVFRRYKGGIPSSDLQEAIYIGFIDCLQEEQTVGDAEAYGEHFMAYLEAIFERQHTPAPLDPATLPNDIVFDAKLESDSHVKLCFDVPQRKLHVFLPKANQCKKAYLLCEYDVTMEGFSVQKPIDKNRHRELLLRGPPRVVAKTNKAPRCAFEKRRKIFFENVGAREEFCCVAALLQHSKSATHSGLRTEALKVYCGTWNVGEKPPGTKHDLSGWLGNGRECDIVAVAAQECDYRPRKPFESCEEDWFYTVWSTLNDRLPEAEQFVLVDGTTMWQMRLVVFAKKKHLACVSDIIHFQEATGLAHVGGNKGGVAVGMKFLETPILFVGCHLAAHQESMMRRHSDIEEIISGISNSIGSRDLYVTTEFPHVFWMGDLNYRIDTLDDSRALCMLKNLKIVLVGVG